VNECVIKNSYLNLNLLFEFYVINLGNVSWTNQSDQRTLLLCIIFFFKRPKWDHFTSAYHSFPDFSSDEPEGFVLGSTHLEGDVGHDHTTQRPAWLSALLQRAPPADVELEFVVVIIKLLSFV
jgi:hypothetical protein